MGKYFELRWGGSLETIRLGDGQVVLKVVDELNDLSKIEIPPKLRLDLPASISVSITTITLSTSDGLPASGYVRIKDEIISYTGLNTTTNQITGVTRGVFGTTADTHSDGAKVTLCAYYEPANPFDIMQSMITDSQDVTVVNPPGGGIDASRVDSAKFATEKAFPGDEPSFSALIVKPVKLNQLLFEISELCCCSLWVNESQKITIRRNNIPNLPSRAYTTITDEANIVQGSAHANLNEESRNSRITIHWDQGAIGDDKKIEDYNAVEISLDSDAESVNEYDGIEEHTIYSRWFRKSWGPYLQSEIIERFVTNLAVRLLVNSRDAHHVIDFEVELKDEGVKVGDHIKLTTDELLMPDGNMLDDAVFSIWKRDPANNRVKLSAIRLRQNKICIIAPDATPVYTSATDTQREYGFISNDSGEMSNGDDGRYIY